MSDPISNMLSAINNALMASHPALDVPFSKFKFEIAKILEKEKFIEKAEKRGKKIKKTIKMTLKYDIDKKPMISKIRRISKQGRRFYTPAQKIKLLKGGLGISIISTTKGLMSSKEARKQKLGGEVICEIW